MRDNKVRNIFIIILGILLLVVFIWMRINSDSNSKNNFNNQNLINSVGTINDYLSFFSVISVIDNLDNSISLGDGPYLINVYDKDYLNENFLNSSNIIKTINPDSFVYNRYIKNIYYNCSNDNCYFFIETFGQKTVYGDMFPEKLANEKFIITVDLSNSAYSIKPVFTELSLKQYMDEYKFEKKSIEKNSNNEFIFSTPDDIKIVNYYLKYLECILLLDTDSAIQYIENYDSSKLIDYLNSSSSMLYTYKKTEIINGFKYSGFLLDGSSFTLYDYAPMNFKISFD